MGWLARATVIETAGDPASGDLRLLLRTEEHKDVLIRYDLGGDRRLPLSAGQAIRVRFYPPRAKGSAASALVLATDEGRALAVIVRDDGLPAGVLPGAASVEVASSTDHLVYTELRQRPSMCVERVAHFDLSLSTEDRVRYLAPGRTHRISLVGTPFALTVYDAARVVGGDCGDDGAVHLSYALIVAPRSRTPPGP